MKKPRYINVIIASLLLTVVSLIVSGGIYWEQVTLKVERAPLVSSTKYVKHCPTSHALSSKLRQAREEVDIPVPSIGEGVAEEETEGEIERREAMVSQHGYMWWFFFEWPTRFFYSTFYGYPDSIQWIEVGYEHSEQKAKIASYLENIFSYRVVAKSNQDFLREEMTVRRWQKETGGYEMYRRNSLKELMYVIRFSCIIFLYGTFCFFIIWTLALFLFPAPVDSSAPLAEEEGFSIPTVLKNLFREGRLEEQVLPTTFSKRFRTAAGLSFAKSPALDEAKLTYGMVSAAKERFLKSPSMAKNVAFLRKANVLFSQDCPSLRWGEVHHHYWKSDSKVREHLIQALLAPAVCPHVVDILFQDKEFLQSIIHSVLKKGDNASLFFPSEFGGVDESNNQSAKPQVGGVRDEEKIIESRITNIKKESVRWVGDLQGAAMMGYGNIKNRFLSTSHLNDEDFDDDEKEEEKKEELETKNGEEPIKSWIANVKKEPLGWINQFKHVIAKGVGNGKPQAARQEAEVMKHGSIEDLVLSIFYQQEAKQSRDFIQDIIFSHIEKKRAAKKMWIGILSQFSPDELLTIKNLGEYEDIIRACLKQNSDKKVAASALVLMLASSSFVESPLMKEEVARLFYEKKDIKLLKKIFIKRLENVDKRSRILSYLKPFQDIGVLKEALARFFSKRENVKAICGNTNLAICLLEKCLLGMGKSQKHIRAILFNDKKSQKHLVASTFYEEAHLPVIETVGHTLFAEHPWFGNTLQTLLQQEAVQRCIVDLGSTSIPKNSRSPLCTPIQNSLKSALPEDLDLADDCLPFLFYSGLFYDQRVRDDFIFAFLDEKKIQDAFESKDTTVAILWYLLWQKIHAGSSRHRFKVLNPLQWVTSLPLYHLSKFLAAYPSNLLLIKRTWIYILKKLGILPKRWASSDVDSLSERLSQHRNDIDDDAVVIFMTIVAVFILSRVAKFIVRNFLQSIFFPFLLSSVVAGTVGEILHGLDRGIVCQFLSPQKLQFLTIIVMILVFILTWMGIAFATYIGRILLSIVSFSLATLLLLKFSLTRKLLLGNIRLAVAAMVLVLIIASSAFFIPIPSGFSTKVLGGFLSSGAAVLLWKLAGDSNPLAGRMRNASAFRKGVYISMLLAGLGVIGVFGFMATDIDGNTIANYAAAFIVGVLLGTLASLLSMNRKVGFLVGFLVIVSGVDQNVIGFLSLWHGLLWNLSQYEEQTPHGPSDDKEIQKGRPDLFWDSVYYVSLCLASLPMAILYGVLTSPIPIFLHHAASVQGSLSLVIGRWLAIFIVVCIFYYAFIYMATNIGHCLPFGYKDSSSGPWYSSVAFYLLFVPFVAYYVNGIRWVSESNHPIMSILRLLWKKTFHYKAFQWLYKGYIFLGNRFLSDKICNKANRKVYMDGAVIHISLLTITLFIAIGFPLNNITKNPASLFNSKLIIFNVLWVWFWELWAWSSYTDLNSFFSSVNDANTYFSYMKRFGNEWVALCGDLFYTFYKPNLYYVAFIITAGFLLIYYTWQLRILELLFSFCLFSFVGVLLRKVITPNTQEKRTARGFAILGIVSILVVINYLLLTFVRYSYSLSYAHHYNQLLLAPYYYELVPI